MIPMLSSLSELEQALELVRETHRELAKEGIEFNPDVPIGGMIEVPAAAVAADLFARKLHFLSIGTNDLIQYTLAIDRIDDEVNYLYDPLHPSVLRLIYRVIEAGRSTGIPVSMCGEMAGDPELTRLLLGLGLREFSMETSSLLQFKQQILNTTVSDIEKKPKTLYSAWNRIVCVTWLRSSTLTGRLYREQLRRKQTLCLQVLGNSMAPEFPDGCVVVSEPVGNLQSGSFVSLNTRVRSY
ncbi:MAG: hypothetical protein Ct9H300mP16_13700 [Pseudomonadota bacterium]|nr:MAG: hypothetical protein Ct9H300mP16_13700 [Pseudomonadota bacterium]